MVMRLYLVASTAPSISPTFDAGWNSTVGAVRRTLATTKAATTEQSTVDIGATGPTYTCQLQLISPPLAAQTISGTVTVISRGRRTASNGVNKRARALRVVSGDGLTVRGVLDPWAATASTTALSNTTLQGQQHALNGALASVTCQDGDRLVVEIGYGVGTSGATPQAVMEWGGTGTDHATSNSDTTGSVPWVEFSQDLTWQAAPTEVFGAGLTALTFTATAAGVREVAGSASGALGFTATAAGTRTVLGTAAGAFTFTATAAGVVSTGPTGVFGAGLTALSFTASASGTRTVTGAAATALGFTAAASGTRTVLGTATAAMSFTASAAGTATSPTAAGTKAGSATTVTGPTSTPTATAAAGSVPALTARRTSTSEVTHG